jgi:hypothetical protein
LASEFGIKFMETSAKNNINVNESFYFLAKDIKDKRMTEAQPNNPGNVSLKDPAPGQAAKNKKGGCCK